MIQPPLTTRRGARAHPPMVTRRTLLARASAAAALGAAALHGVGAARALEKTRLNIGFIPLTDMAPLAVALEEGFFAEEGLDVELVKQRSWPELLANLRAGALDAAHMLSGQPLATALEAERSGDASGRVVAAMSLDRNGNAVTVSNEVWELMDAPRDASDRTLHPISASTLRSAVFAFRRQQRPMIFGMVDTVSNHNFELRYWLAAGGMHPGFYEPNSAPGSDAQLGAAQADIQLLVAPPPFMPVSLQAGLFDGYCVGEPWNQQAVSDRTGVVVISDHQIWADNPEKLLGLRADFAAAAPRATRALLKAVTRACQWLDAADPGADFEVRRRKAVQLLRRPEHIGASSRVLSSSLLGTFEFEPGDVREAPSFNVFFNDFATYPFASDGVWFLTQMRRWGQIDGARPDDWYRDVAERTYRADLYLDAARVLVDEGKLSAEDVPFASDGYRAPSAAFIDGRTFDAAAPNAYIDAAAIGLKGAHVMREGLVRDG